MEYKPNDYQRKAVRYIMNHNRCILCMEPGMGKTSAVLTALNSLKYDCFDKGRIVVVTAQTDAVNRWIPEMHKWNHLSGLTACRAYGQKTTGETAGSCDITFTSPGMCRDIISRIGKESLTLIIDRACSHFFCLLKTTEKY